MTREENEALVRRLSDEIWHAESLSIVEDVYAADNDPWTRERFRGFVVALRSALPDVQMRIEHLVAGDDDVAVHWRIQGTHQGRLEGLSVSEVVGAGPPGQDHLRFLCEVVPTHRHISFDGVSIFRIENGRIVAAWMLVDQLNLLRQLGALPVPDRGKQA